MSGSVLRARKPEGVPRPWQLRKSLNGASYERPLIFWISVVLILTGVFMQLPMFYMARMNHYRLAGMPVTNEMLIGMGLVFAGLGLCAYSLFPSARAVRPELSRISIAPLDDAAIKLAHIGLLIVMSLAIAIDGMKPAAFAFLAPGAAAEYGLKSPLNPTAHALSIALYPLFGIGGTVAGSFVWGWLGDRMGWRASILLAAMIFIATSTCGCMPRYWMNLVTCFIMGVGVGGLLPIGFTLLSETVPRRHRGWMMVSLGSSIALAYLVVSWLAATWASPAHFGWRLLWLVGLPSGLLLLLLNRWIPESPRFLLAQGRNQEARAIMRRYGATVTEGESELAVEKELVGGFRLLVSGPFIALSAAIVLLALSVGTTQYGFSQSIPSNLQRLGLSSVSASALLRNAAIIGFPFSLPVALLYARWGGKKTVLLVAAIMAAALGAFVILGNHVTASHVVLYAPARGAGLGNQHPLLRARRIHGGGVPHRHQVPRHRSVRGSHQARRRADPGPGRGGRRRAVDPGHRGDWRRPRLAVVAIAAFGPETRFKPLEQIRSRNSSARVPRCGRRPSPPGSRGRARRP